MNVIEVKNMSKNFRNKKLFKYFFIDLIFKEYNFYI